MADSQIATIKDNLVTQLSAVAGIVTVYRDPPGIVQFNPPSLQECPAVLIEFRKPAFTRFARSLGDTTYTWHFDLTVFFCPIGVKTPSTRVSGFEAIPQLIIARLNAHNSLSQACTSVKFDSDGDIGYFSKWNNDYYGAVMRLDIFEDVAETYAA